MDYGGESKTDKRVVVKVPQGCIVVRRKWKASKLISKLRDSGNVMFEERLDYVDIFTPSKLAILILEETDLSAESDFKRSLVKLRQLDGYKGVVLVKKPVSTQPFLSLQKFISLDLGLVCVPFNDLNEAGSFLAELVFMDSATKQIDKKKAQIKSADERILTSLSVIPKLGLAKSKLLLGRFSS